MRYDLRLSSNYARLVKISRRSEHTVKAHITYVVPRRQNVVNRAVQFAHDSPSLANNSFLYLLFLWPRTCFMHPRIVRRKVGTGKCWVMNGALIALLGSVGVAQQIGPASSMSVDDIIQSMQTAQAAVRPQVSYQVIREYRLFSAQDSKPDSEVVAEVNFRPPTSKVYRIQRSEGSNRGQQLVRRILDHEVEASSAENKAGRAITRDNYSFDYIGEAMLEGQPCYVLGLKPKRTDKNLIRGKVWVDQHSFLVRQIDGEAEKTPSWWLKSVRIKLEFADLDGMWMQTRMEAVADVRIVGARTLTSRILDYRKESEVATTPFTAAFILPKR